MNYSSSISAMAIFGFFVAAVLVLSFYLGRRAKSAAGYYAAHGQIHWFVNGVAFAGDYLSAASFLGICGLIATVGYDGFLYSIGFLAGWVVALFVIAEPIKRLGKYTFADALDSQFNSRGIKLTAALSTLVVSVFYLIPQMVGAGALIKPLLGLEHWQGVLIVGVTVTLIVVTAGMVSTTWVQFIKGSMLVIFCTVLVGMILQRGFTAQPKAAEPAADQNVAEVKGFITTNAYALEHHSHAVKLPLGPVWKNYVKYQFPDGGVRTFRVNAPADGVAAQPILTEAQVLSDTGTAKFVNDVPKAQEDIKPVGTIVALPAQYAAGSTGAQGPLEFFGTLSGSRVLTWKTEKIQDGKTANTVFYQAEKSGADLLTPGVKYTGLRAPGLWGKLDFISLMLGLFFGTASLPHILIRYYTVKDQSAARKSTIVGIATIGFFYVLTLYLGLGAMTSGTQDPTDSNMAAPLLARSFSQGLFAIISAIAFTTVLGTVSGLILAGSGAVAHDFMENFLQMKMTDRQKVFYGKVAAAFLGVGAMVLGIIFKGFNVSFLVGWAFNIAASANLPALVMLLFWKGTTARGITAAVTVGLLSSLGWILLSGDCYRDVYGLDPAKSIIPFSQPALVTVPLGFVTLVVVSFLTKGRTAARGLPVEQAAGKA